MPTYPMLENDDLLLTGERRYAKSDIRHWQACVFQRVRNRNGRKEKAASYSVQLQFGGRREEFNLSTANKAMAASKAREIHQHLEVNGWDATLAKYKPGNKREVSQQQIGIRTVGEFIRAIQATTPASRTIAAYCQRFRKIVADVFELAGDASRFDCHAGGHDAWLQQIDRIELSALTPARIQSWKVNYLNKAGKSPAAARSAKITINSNLRQARALFSKERLAFVQLTEGFRSPFEGVQLEAGQNMRYRGGFDVQQLIADAKNELADDDPEAFKIFLLALMAGLRRGEIDQLQWDAFDWKQQTLHLEAQHLALKSESSADSIDLEPELVAVFQEFYTRATGAFVIESTLMGKTATSYLDYRCERVFTRFSVWLRAHGVASTKPLHMLRKEYGSQVCARHGLYAASRALRHSDVRVTQQHYLDKRERATSGLGHHL
jgi:integrase